MKKLINKKIVLSILLFSISIGVSIFLYERRVEKIENAVQVTVTELSVGSQLHGIMSVLFIMLIGLAVLYLANIIPNVYDMFLLSLPAGIVLWITASAILLLSGLPYTFVSVLLLIVVFLFFWGIRDRRNSQHHLHYNKNDLLFSAIIFVSLLIFVSTGILYIVETYDSLYFIEMLGRALANERYITESYIPMLSHTSLGISTLSSLSFFFGRDNLYVIHGSFVLFFWLYYIRQSFRLLRGKKLLEKILVLVGMISMPCVLMQTMWVISNTYVMVYLVLTTMLYSRIERKMSDGHKMVSVFLFFMLAFIRSEAPIVICCMLIGLSASQVNDAFILRNAWLPAFAGTVLMYARIITAHGGKHETLVNTSTMQMMAGLYVLVFIYYVFKHKLYIIQRHLYIWILVGMFLVFAALFVYDSDMCIGTIHTLIYNFTDFSWENVWGLSMIFYLLLLLYIRKESVNIDWVSCCVLTLFLMEVNLAILRGLTSTPARIGYGDSFSRSFASYMPLAFYALSREMVQKDTEYGNEK